MFDEQIHKAKVGSKKVDMGKLLDTELWELLKQAMVDAMANAHLLPCFQLFLYLLKVGCAEDHSLVVPSLDLVLVLLKDYQAASAPTPQWLIHFRTLLDILV
eukprot:CAMPEP_0201285926 /NCGR_PEP_ID=MMETSP1317-20130820/114024_1 /ASSEMBLY_ACC=CAM_ASM_000770 /TAXON_ID=187299 /ORGANISM="Undescribed Undescribed, Strain Undescribed" /LENGTH=101 /DNA_ID=CAMNT_0047612143 /DNA_START=3121 /DNA_END=3426 /DNA_ORIENTATION=-